MFLSGRSTIYTFAPSVFKIMKGIMKRMDEREKLIKDLSGNPYYMTDKECKLLSEYIIADRRRILMPLIEWKKEMLEAHLEWPIAEIEIRVEKTLKNAGIE